MSPPSLGELGDKKPQVPYYQGYSNKLSPWATDRVSYIYLTGLVKRED